jgi:hypothetical protein
VGKYLGEAFAACGRPESSDFTYNACIGSEQPPRPTPHASPDAAGLDPAERPLNDLNTNLCDLVKHSDYAS